MTGLTALLDQRLTCTPIGCQTVLVSRDVVIRASTWPLSDSLVEEGAHLTALLDQRLTCTPIGCQTVLVSRDVVIRASTWAWSESLVEEGAQRLSRDPVMEGLCARGVS